MFSTPLPHVNVVSVVALSKKKSRVTCKLQETTLSGGEGGFGPDSPYTRYDGSCYPAGSPEIFEMVFPPF